MHIHSKDIGVPGTRTGAAAVIPVGECRSMKDHIQSAILNDAEFISLKRRCGHLRDYIAVAPRFRPTSFTIGRLNAFRHALMNFNVCEIEQRQSVLDYLWRYEPDAPWPLALRMAQRKNPSFYDSNDDSLSSPEPNTTFGLHEQKEAILRRDLLISEMIEAIFNRKIQVTAFLAGDVQRQRVEISPEWWLDPIMVCNWKAGELSPVEGAPLGSPHYRGLQLASRSDSGSAIYSTGLGGRPTSKHLFMPKLIERANVLEPSLTKEAAWLLAWLKSEHPGAPPCTQKTIEEAIRAEFRRLKPQKPTPKTT